ncbi:MAG: type I-E CRISPR-associated protein Cas7/Cse4/CasC [Chloroflexota bacterium]
MFIELHFIQNFAPSNLNRDDTNNPKDCDFGGVRRARISSQCLKRAIRQAPIFSETTKVDNGLRTRWLARRMKDDLMKAGKPESEAISLANEFAKTYASKLEKSNEKEISRTSVLVFVSSQEINEAVNSLLQGQAVVAAAESLAKKSKKRTSAPDIAMFGRMLAEKPDLNLDAACQVAHAISTHRVNMEMDFFTAVDDFQEQETDETGAGMMGVVGFNSACFYRYACLDWNQLLTNLAGEQDLAKRTLEAFLRAAVIAVPSGKQNSFAAQNPPSFLLAVIRKDGMNWSLANAFEKPISATREDGLIANSVKALDAYWGRLIKVFGGAQVIPIALSIDEDLPLSALKGSVMADQKSWIDAILTSLDH